MTTWLGKEKGSVIDEEGWDYLIECDQIKIVDGEKMVVYNHVCDTFSDNSYSFFYDLDVNEYNDNNPIGTIKKTICRELEYGAKLTAYITEDIRMHLKFQDHFGGILWIHIKPSIPIDEIHIYKDEFITYNNWQDIDYHMDFDKYVKFINKDIYDALVLWIELQWT